ncbi:MAG: hypothetical protein ACKN83_04725 [Vulcanococcus sp.]
MPWGFFMGLTRQSLVDSLIAGASVLLVSLLALSLGLRDEVRGDLVVQVLIAIKDFSVYFWGQDRYFSLVPLLLSWNHDPVLGLYLTSLLNACAFFGVIYVLIAAVDGFLGQGTPASKGSAVKRLLLLIALALLVRLLWSHEETYFFVKDASPFPLSLLLGLGSVALWLPLLKRSFTGISRGLVFWSVVFLVLTGLELAVAPTTLGTCVVLLLVSMLMSADQQRQPFCWWFVACVGYILASFGCWLLIQLADRLLGVVRLANYAAPARADWLTSMGSSWQVVLGERGGFWGLLVCLLIVVFSFALCCFSCSPRLGKALVAAQSLVWLYAFIVLFLFSRAAWVEANGFHFRYQYPLYVAWLFSAVVLLTLLSRDLHALWCFLSRARLRLVIALLCLSLGFFAVVIRPLPLEAASVRRSIPVLEFMGRRGFVALAGNFWSVWPAYLAAISSPSLPDVESIAHRSSGNFLSHERLRSLVQGAAERRQPFSVVCYEDSYESCVNQVEHVIYSLPYTFEYAPSVQSGRPPGVTLLTVAVRS